MQKMSLNFSLLLHVHEEAVDAIDVQCVIKGFIECHPTMCMANRYIETLKNSISRKMLEKMLKRLFHFTTFLILKVHLHTLGYII